MCIINGIEIDPAMDGETHINIYSGANTNLGRLLSNFTYMPSQTPHGEFVSLEGYYHWLKLTNSIRQHFEPLEGWVEELDVLRNLHGIYAQQKGRKFRHALMMHNVRIIDKPTAEFTATFTAAMLSKVMSNKELFNELKENRLPLVHYYLMNGKVVYKNHYSWLSDIATDINVKILGL